MNVITRSLIGGTIIAGLTLLIAGSCHAASDVRQIDTAELQSMMEQNSEISLINVLPKIIHDAKHIPGSLNIPLGRIRDTNALPKKLNSPLVFYCMGLL